MVEFAICQKYLSNIPNVGINGVNLYTIWKSIFRTTNLNFKLNRNIQSTWSYKQNNWPALLFLCKPATTLSYNNILIYLCLLLHIYSQYMLTLFSSSYHHHTPSYIFLVLLNILSSTFLFMSEIHGNLSSFPDRKHSKERLMDLSHLEWL
jgi:hypothetical protein